MAEYFVKNGGSDGAAGTSDGAAWATIARVNSATLNPGDIVNFKRGSRFDDATLNRSLVGTSGNVILFRAYDSGAKPIIAGGPVLGPWTSMTGPPAHWRAALARTPVEICVAEYQYLTAVGSIALLTPGTYFYDSAGDFLHLRLAGDAAPAGFLIEAQILNRCITPSSCAWFTLEDVEVRAAALDGWLGDAASINHLTLRRVVGRACKQYGIYIVFGQSIALASTDILVEDCEGHYCGADGVALGGWWQRVTITGMRTSFNCVHSGINWTAGFRSTGVDWSTDLIITDAWSWSNGTIGNPPTEGGYGIWLDAIATGCQVRNSRAWGNRFYGFNMEQVRGTNSTNGLLFANNVSYENLDGGITIRTNSDYCRTANNLAYDNGSNNLHFANAQVSVNAKNNIAIRGPSFPTARCLGVRTGASTSMILTNNNFGAQQSGFVDWEETALSTYATLETAYGGAMSNVTVDPQLYAPETADFRLMVSSMCRDRGLNVGLPYYGFLPDIGAIELPPVMAAGCMGIGV